MDESLRANEAKVASRPLSGQACMTRSVWPARYSRGTQCIHKKTLKKNLVTVGLIHHFVSCCCCCCIHATCCCWAESHASPVLPRHAITSAGRYWQRRRRLRCKKRVDSFIWLGVYSARRPLLFAERCSKSRTVFLFCGEVTQVCAFSPDIFHSLIERPLL